VIVLDVGEYIGVDEIASLLKKLIQIPSVEKNETLVSEKIIDVLEKEGIESYELIESGEGRGNLIVTLKGKRGSGYNLMVIGHLDVVPVESKWSVDPFGGIERNGYIYGRGAIDDKGQVAAMTYLAVFLHRINYDFSGTVKLFMVADEETQNPKHGMRFLIKERPDLFKNIHGAIGELGGMIEFGGKKRQVIIFGEKGAVTLRITSLGERGHASQTYRVNNSIKNVAEAILRIPDAKFFISRPIRVMLKNMLGIKSLFIMNRILNKFTLRMIKDIMLARMLHAMTHITIAKTVVHGGKAENVYPEEAKLTLDIRYFPEQNNLHEIINLIKKSLPKHRYKIEKVSQIPSTYSSTNTKLYRTIEKTVRDMGYEPFSIIQMGSSDSAWVRQLGIPTYHFMTTTRPMDVETIHGTDERIWKKDLITIVEGYWRLIQNLGLGQ